MYCIVTDVGVCLFVYKCRHRCECSRILLMNIFWLHCLLAKNAEYYHDKHVVKIILEITQMLWSVYHHYGLPQLENVPVKVYRQTHKNHPCSKWCRENVANYKKAAEMGLALCSEYTFRFGKQHKCQEIIEWLLLNPPDTIPESGQVTCPPLCMPEQYKRTGKPIESYRRYYIGEKINENTRWKKRKQPRFVTDNNPVTKRRKHKTDNQRCIASVQV